MAVLYPTKAEYKNWWGFTSTPPYVMVWCLRTGTTLLAQFTDMFVIQLHTKLGMPSSDRSLFSIKLRLTYGPRCLCFTFYKNASIRVAHYSRIYYQTKSRDSALSVTFTSEFRAAIMFMQLMV